MPPPPILDPATLEFEHPFADREAVMARNPQRHEFQLLDAVVMMDVENGVYAGYHDVKPDAWWTRGHVPGRPLFPGVLMIEVAAQLASFLYNYKLGGDKFLGFVGVEGVKFRGTVEPACRLMMVGRTRYLRPRRVMCDAQGFVDGKMVFEGTIAGMPV